MMSGVSPIRFQTELVIQGNTQPCRLCRISINSSMPKRVNPISIRCAGTIAHSNAPGVKATTSVHGEYITTNPDANVTAVKRRAASTPLIKTVQKAADVAVKTGGRLYTDSASRYRALKGYVPDYVNHTQKEYARGDVHENRAECLFSLLKTNLLGYLGFFQFLRNDCQLTAFEQAEMLLYAALEPSVASRAKKGDFVRCLDHFDLLQTQEN
jgi:ISXO2-like transposase domain